MGGPVRGRQLRRAADLLHDRGFETGRRSLEGSTVSKQRGDLGQLSGLGVRLGVGALFEGSSLLWLKCVESVGSCQQAELLIDGASLRRVTCGYRGSAQRLSSGCHLRAESLEAVSHASLDGSQRQVQF